MKIKNLGRVVKLTVGGIAVIAIFFFGTLYTLDYLNPDSLRARQANLLKAALEEYRLAHGMYPQPFPDNPITELKKYLVDGGYLSTIAEDPAFSGFPRYTLGGKTYGLLFKLERSAGKIPAGGPCLTGVGYAGTGWYGQPPDCPF